MVYTIYVTGFGKTRHLHTKKNTVWRETLAGGNVGESGELSMICQTKTIQISAYN